MPPSLLVVLLLCEQHLALCKNSYHKTLLFFNLVKMNELINFCKVCCTFCPFSVIKIKPLPLNPFLFVTILNRL